MTTKLGLEMMPVLDKLWDVLEGECDSPVMMQKAIELIISRFSCKMGNRKDSLYVAHHINRHAQQLINQVFDTWGGPNDFRVHRKRNRG